MDIVIFWFRRDLRLEDNTALFEALNSGRQVLPLFIFDQQILNELPWNDARVSFIYEELGKIHTELRQVGFSLLVRHGNPEEVWKELTDEFEIQSIYVNEDYEPYAIRRDESIKQLVAPQGIDFFSFKDQVIFRPDEILKPADHKPYTIYTPYKNKWLEKFRQSPTKPLSAINKITFTKLIMSFLPLKILGFKKARLG